MIKLFPSILISFSVSATQIELRNKEGKRKNQSLSKLSKIIFTTIFRNNINSQFSNTKDTQSSGTKSLTPFKKKKKETPLDQLHYSPNILANSAHLYHRIHECKQSRRKQNNPTRRVDNTAVGSPSA